MKKILLSLLISAFACSAFAIGDNQEQVFKAMQDEMDRTMDNLAAQNMAKPYFTAYKVTDITSYDFNAIFGSLSGETKEERPLVQVMMRIGSPKDDNSFFKSYASLNSQIQYPAQGYQGIRAGLWAISDFTYKQALAQLAKKEAYKKNKNITEMFDDFSDARTTSDIEEITPKNIDENFWRDMAKQTSLQGKDLGLDQFITSIDISLKPTYFLTSEGAKYLKDDYSVNITLIAQGKTPDGFDISQKRAFNYVNFSDVPSVAEMSAAAKEFAQDTAGLIKGKKAEPFIGPVMLEKRAAAILFDKAFRTNIINTKKVLSASDSKGDMGEFAQKKGLKIMPVDFDVIDDPLMKTFKNTSLAGYYKVDDEGVKAGKLQLVKDGKLINLPTTRSLIKDQKTSNGHARISFYDDALIGPQAFIGNLLFLPHKTVEEKDLKTKFMEFCKEEGLDYCYIIRNNPLSGTLTGYKTDASTGEETPVYAIDSADFTTRTLRDIKYAGDDLEVYNSVSMYSPQYTIVAPSVILTELELNPTQKTGARKPLVKRP